MKIVCIGGGPAGLYFALLMKKLGAHHDITVVERNRPYDTFGWGVVFSDATKDNMRAWDAPTADAIEVAFNHWDDIELHFKGRTIRSGGHGFVGIGRKKLLNILQARCEELGVRLFFETDVDSDADYPDADLIIASDGINSKIRGKYAEVFRPDIVTRPNRYIWLGTNKLYDAFTFLFEKTEAGWFQAHIYNFDDSTSTFIVVCPEHVWLAHGLDKADPEQSVAFCEKLFAANLQGEKLMTNARHLRGSAWINFQRVKCEQWSHFNGSSHVVLMGDAVHTAHFAIGISKKQPLLLIVDDLHWVDTSSAELLFHLARRMGESRIMVLGTYRPDEVALGRKGERHPLEKVLAAGQHSLEHPRIFLFECYRGAAAFRALPDPMAAYTIDMRARLVDGHDPVRCAELMAAMAASGPWWSPTLQVLRMSALAGNREFREDPRRRYIPFIFWAGLWQPDADRAVADARHASGRDVHAELYRLAMDNVRQAQNAGVRLVAGTDAGDSYVFPGFSIHDELAELVRAGFAPADALRSATIDAARFSGEVRDYGSIEAGKVADMVLLTANPLADIRGTGQIAGLFFNGQYLDRAALDALLAFAEDQAGSLRTNRKVTILQGKSRVNSPPAKPPF